MDVFSLKAKISLDSSDFDKGLGAAKKALGAVGSAVKTGMKVTAAAVGAASAAVGVLVKKSVDAYGEYEQLVGGIKKLYGNMGLSLTEYAQEQGKSVDAVEEEWKRLEQAQTTVLKNAQNAYKTAGMSTNQYLETATSFSASLISSLGGDTQAAADLTDTAMRSISDNWNTFGGDLEGITNAYKGFSKGTFTMLDNLKLGYGGTKEEMQKLIADAASYTDIQEKLNLTVDEGSLAFDNIVKAIEVVQAKQQIAGTTAREATTTIQGSLGMAKAAWENLVTGLSDENANLDTLMANLVDSIVGYTDEAGNHVKGVFDNIIPVIEKALENVGQLVERMAPLISEKLPGIIQSTLPSLINAASTLVSGIAQALPDLVVVIVEQIPGIISQVGSALVDAGGALLDAAGDLMMNLYFGLLDFDWDGLGETIGNMIGGIFDPQNNVTAMEHLIACGLGIVEAVIQGITKALPSVVKGATEFITEFAEYLSGDAEDNPHIIESAMDLIGTLASEMGKAAPKLIPSVIQSILSEIQKIIKSDGIKKMIDGAVDLVLGLVKGLTDPQTLGGIIEAAVTLIVTLADGLIEALPRLIQAIPEIIGNLLQAILENAPTLLEGAFELIYTLIQGLFEALPDLIAIMPEIIMELLVALLEAAPELLEGGIEIVMTIIEGILSSIGEFLEMAPELITKFLDALLEYAPRLLEAGQEMIQQVKDGIMDKIDGAREWGSDLIHNFVDGIKSAIGSVKDAVSNVADAVRSRLHFSEPDVGPLKDFHTYAPDMMKLFAEGIKDNTDIVSDQIQKSFDFSDVIADQTVNMNGNSGRSPLGNVTINVYGAEGQSEERLAELVEKRLLHEYNQQRAVVYA